MNAENKIGVLAGAMLAVPIVAVEISVGSRIIRNRSERQRERQIEAIKQKQIRDKYTADSTNFAGA